jgi:tRNA threonylcarbamoyladenosine biosynthesis protein TsaE
MVAAEGLLADAEATAACGAGLAGCCEPGLLVYLQGELGAGKTTLVRGLLRALGHTGAVKSPTYTLVESYPSDTLPVHHLDLYRLTDPEELEWLGIRDLLAADALCLIEWPERGSGLLPAPDLCVTLSYHDGGRRIRVQSESERGARAGNCLKAVLQHIGI